MIVNERALEILVKEKLIVVYSKAVVGRAAFEPLPAPPWAHAVLERLISCSARAARERPSPFPTRTAFYDLDPFPTALRVIPHPDLSLRGV